MGLRCWNHCPLACPLVRQMATSKARENPEDSRCPCPGKRQRDGEWAIGGLSRLPGDDPLGGISAADSSSGLRTAWACWARSWPLSRASAYAHARVRARASSASGIKQSCLSFLFACLLADTRIRAREGWGTAFTGEVRVLAGQQWFPRYELETKTLGWRLIAVTKAFAALFQALRAIRILLVSRTFRAIPSFRYDVAWGSVSLRSDAPGYVVPWLGLRPFSRIDIDCACARC